MTTPGGHFVLPTRFFIAFAVSCFTWTFRLATAFLPTMLVVSRTDTARPQNENAVLTV